MHTCHISIAEVFCPYSLLTFDLGSYGYQWDLSETSTCWYSADCKAQAWESRRRARQTILRSVMPFWCGSRAGSARVPPDSIVRTSHQQMPVRSADLRSTKDYRVIQLTMVNVARGTPIGPWIDLRALSCWDWQPSKHSTRTDCKYFVVATEALPSYSTWKSLIESLTPGRLPLKFLLPYHRLHRNLSCVYGPWLPSYRHRPGPQHRY